jgi:hypothetical protein
MAERRHPNHDGVVTPSAGRLHERPPIGAVEPGDLLISARHVVPISNDLAQMIRRARARGDVIPAEVLRLFRGLAEARGDR